MPEPHRHSCLHRLLLFALALIGGAVLAQTPTRPTVIELFTSQGCSSCPPADALLGELAQRPDVIALAFHVDYWDYIGWRDRFALPLSAQRQRQYETSLRLRNSFTPQAIIDGDRSVLGSNRSALLAAIKATPGVAMRLTPSATGLIIALDEWQGSQHLDVNMISYLPKSTTAIARGENAGHVLQEFNIVRSFRRLDQWDGKPRRFNVPLSSLPADASKVAVLLQLPGAGHIVGAASISIR